MNNAAAFLLIYDSIVPNFPFAQLRKGKISEKASTNLEATGNYVTICKGALS
jgi:hypothetical protein